jgi:hypothetical protein
MGVCKRKGYCNIDVNGLDRECCPYSWKVFSLGFFMELFRTFQ